MDTGRSIPVLALTDISGSSLCSGLIPPKPRTAENRPGSSISSLFDKATCSAARWLRVSIKNPSRERAFSLAKNFATLLNED
jgi:hypothetical protein